MEKAIIKFSDHLHNWGGIAIVNNIEDNYNFAALKPEPEAEKFYAKLIDIIKKHGKYETCEIKEMMKGYEEGPFLKFWCNVTTDNVPHVSIKDFSLEYAPLI